MNPLAILISAVLLVISSSLFGQVQKSTMELVLVSIAEEGVLYGPAVGYSGEEPEQWKRYEYLRDNSTEEELIRLKDHANPIVRCYAFDALLYGNHGNLYSTLMKHLNDTTSFLFIEGCIGDYKTVRDYCLSSAKYKCFSDVLLEPDKLNQQSFDSVLCFLTWGRLNSHSDQGSKVASDENYYSRMREIASLGGCSSCLIDFASLHRSADTSVIIKALISNNVSDNYYALRTIKLSPHPSFLPYLQKLHAKRLGLGEDSIHRVYPHLYLAAAKFSPNDLATILEMTFENVSVESLPKHAEMIYGILSKSPDPCFENILERAESAMYTKY